MRTLSAFTVLFLVGACQAPPAEMTVDLEANKQVVRDVYTALDAQDYDKIRSLMAEDFTLGLVGTSEVMNTEAMLERVRASFAAFPDYTHVVDFMVAEGDWVAVKVTLRATHQGEIYGIPASGKAVEYGGAHFIRVVDGLVQETLLMENDLSLLTQIGMQLVPAEER